MSNLTIDINLCADVPPNSPNSNSSFWEENSPHFFPQSPLNEIYTKVQEIIDSVEFCDYCVEELGNCCIRECYSCGVISCTNKVHDVNGNDMCIYCLAR